jgi:hypothetical protein
MVALWLLLMVPAVAGKELEMAPAATATDPGIVNSVLLSDNITVLPADGATWFRVTVHVVAAPELTVAGLQAKLDTRVGAIRLTVVVCKEPFNVALILALWFVLNAPTVPMKAAELAPTATVTDEGINIRALLSDSGTVVLDKAIWFKPTVQVVEAPAATEVGVQVNDDKPSGAPTLIVPADVFVCIALPDTDVLKALFTLMAVVPVAVADMVTVKTAIWPF